MAADAELSDLIRDAFTPEELREFAFAWEAADRARVERRSEAAIRRLLGPTLRTVRDGTPQPPIDLPTLGRCAAIAIEAGLQPVTVIAAAILIGSNAGLDPDELDAQLTAALGEAL